MKLFILAAFLLIFASKMAYVWRGRGPRTRGGVQRGNFAASGYTNYTRSDENMFACLRGMEQDGDTDSNMTSDTDEQDETISDKSQSLLHEARFQKKRKLNISGGDSHYKSDLDLHEEPTERVDYESLPTEKKLNLILSKVCLNNRRFSRLEQIFETVSNARTSYIYH